MSKTEKVIIVILLSLLILMSAYFFLGDNNGQNEAFNTGFTNSVVINISPSSDGTLRDYQMQFVIPYEPEMQSDFDDLRFVDENGNQLAYWIEEKTNDIFAKVWVKVPKINAKTGATITMYYGNPTIGSESDISRVMIFYDLFEGSSIDSSKWIQTEYGSVSHSVSDGTYTSSLLQGPINSGNVLESVMSFEGPITVNVDYYYSPSNGYPYADIFYGSGYSGDYKSVKNGWFYDSHQPNDESNSLVRYYTDGIPETIYSSDDISMFFSNNWQSLVFKLGGTNVVIYNDGVERINVHGEFDNSKGTIRLSHFTAHYKTGTLMMKKFFVREYASSEPLYSFVS
jgi:hypothetical protein